jgi:hypothetical protein
MMTSHPGRRLELPSRRVGSIIALGRSGSVFDPGLQVRAAG